MIQLLQNKTAKRRNVCLLFAVFISIFLYGAFYYNLVRRNLLILTQKQSALESINAVAVPGTSFLNSLDSFFILKSSLFYLIILGMMFFVFMLISLIFSSFRKRAFFLSSGLLVLAAIVINDRINLSFILVIFVSFASFCLLTQSLRIGFSFKEILIILLLTVFISLLIFYGAKGVFFSKTRDKVLFDSTIGNKIVSYYYTYSPLATIPISRERGIYVGLIFYEGLETEDLIHLGNGLFLSNKKNIKESTDFVLAKENEKYILTNRYGKRIIIDSINLKAIEEAIGRLFTMNGFLVLTKIGLHFFPVSLFLLFLIGVKCLTNNNTIAIISSVLTVAIIILFIWFVNLAGNHLPKMDKLKSYELQKYGLSMAYHLYQKSKIPENYAPIINKMAGSESIALRYWGAKLLGKTANAKDAKILLALMDDASPNVRYAAAHALYRLLKDKSFRVLRPRLLNDPSWYVRCSLFSIFLNTGTIPTPN